MFTVSLYCLKINTIYLKQTFLKHYVKQISLSVKKYIFNANLDIIKHLISNNNEQVEFEIDVLIII